LENHFAVVDDGVHHVHHGFGTTDLEGDLQECRNMALGNQKTIITIKNDTIMKTKIFSLAVLALTVLMTGQRTIPFSFC
jgi:hypothetical protein